MISRRKLVVGTTLAMPLLAAGTCVNGLTPQAVTQDVQFITKGARAVETALEGMLPPGPALANVKVWIADVLGAEASVASDATTATSWVTWVSDIVGVAAGLSGLGMPLQLILASISALLPEAITLLHVALPASAPRMAAMKLPWKPVTPADARVILGNL